MSNHAGLQELQALTNTLQSITTDLATAMAYKNCRKCKIDRRPEDFYAWRNVCKICARAYGASRRGNPAIRKLQLAHMVLYSARPEVKERKRNYMKEYFSSSEMKEKRTAYMVAYDAERSRNVHRRASKAKRSSEHYQNNRAKQNVLRRYAELFTSIT